MGNPTAIAPPVTAPISPQSQPTAIVHAFPSRLSGTTVYIVIDPVTEEAAIINPVLDLDPLTNEIRTRSADRLLKFINDEGLTVKWILETALHRNRISACRYIQLMLQHIGDGTIPQVCVGENSFCTCGDDEPTSPSSNNNDLRKTTTNTSQKSPEAFDKLFEDGEQLSLGNIVAQCTHLDDHEGITYTFGHSMFSSGGISINSSDDSTTTNATALQNIITHAEPPPERPSTGGPVSSRQSMTIDEVLGSAASNTSAGSNSTEEPLSPSPLLAFYAEQVNTRGGRIPKKINLTGHMRKASLGSVDSEGSGKGKERERAGSNGSQGQVAPLRIPRKLSIIMC